METTIIRIVNEFHNRETTARIPADRIEQASGYFRYHLSDGQARRVRRELCSSYARLHGRNGGCQCGGVRMRGVSVDWSENMLTSDFSLAE